MAGSETCTVVTVEVLVEQDQVTPVRVFLERLWCKFEVEQYSVGLVRSIE
jgi:hypothetical protein